MENVNEKLLEFIRRCPSSFHTVQTVAERLEDEGYCPLQEGKPWELLPGGKYYLTRNRSSLIAFRVPKGEVQSFLLTASHGESPAFKVKPEPELPVESAYLKLNTEKYGGMLYTSWLDRPLSVAGRIVVKTENGIETRLVDVDRDLLVIPSLAIHMNRSANEGVALNPQKDLLPLFSEGIEKGSFWDLIAQTAHVAKEDIIGSDLFVYCRSQGTVWGKNEEFISAPRLDDLQCVFGTLEGFLSAKEKQSMPVYCLFDNEEVGSGTKQGAQSTFLPDTMQRICMALSIGKEEYLQMLSSSFMLSADNGHGLHPNYPEKTDPTNRPKLGGGLLLKYNANQNYTTDGISEAVVVTICQKAGVPVQKYVNPSDIPGGSTLGNLSARKVSINTADIGLAQLSMHAAWETASAKDTAYLIAAIREFYSTNVLVLDDGRLSLM